MEMRFGATETMTPGIVAEIIEAFLDSPHFIGFDGPTTHLAWNSLTKEAERHLPGEFDSHRQ